MKAQTILTFCFVLLAAAVCQAANDGETLRIHLPRQITIDTQTPTLGQIAILRGDEAQVAQAEKITVGRLATADQTLTITPDIVRSRLACSGIDTARVTLTGAEEMIVTRNCRQISGQQFADAAAAFLKDNLPDPSICETKAVRLPNSVLAPGSSDTLTFESHLVSLRGNQCKVRTTALCDGSAVASCETVFLCGYKTRKIVAAAPIVRGQTLTQDNVTVTDDVAARPQPADWTAPFGQVAKRDFAVGDEIPSHLVAAPQPEVLLKRNQTVTIVINRAGFVASAIGTAMEEGVCGQLVKVKNIDSQKVIVAKVIDNGTVEPVF